MATRLAYTVFGPSMVYRRDDTEAVELCARLTGSAMQNL